MRIKRWAEGQFDTLEIVLNTRTRRRLLEELIASATDDELRAAGATRSGSEIPCGCDGGYVKDAASGWPTVCPRCNGRGRRRPS